MLAYPSIFSRLTTGLDFTTSVCELPCASSTFLTVNTVYRTNERTNERTLTQSGSATHLTVSSVGGHHLRSPTFGEPELTSLHTTEVTEVTLSATVHAVAA